ncbi:MAG: hypothetical protein RR035_06210, partial [Oscillibacter sp.]
MDEYLDCLYRYVQENRVGRAVWRSPEYRRLSLLREMALQTLTERLTPEQADCLTRFRDAEADFALEEAQILFQEAVALGRWMARP